jgi:hypothetical protein
MARWQSCNVLQPGSEIRNLWQFAAGGSKVTLQREEVKLPSEPLPEKLISKDWQALFQPRLNVAWLPSEKVFLRVVQVPKADAAETQSMVELQLEKLSPLPVAQVVWGYETLPAADRDMQTAVVIIVPRAYVEEFLGHLEGQGFLADRLELPFLDQLRATRVEADGAWIYPGVGGDSASCLVAWWYGRTLRNLCLVHLPAGEQRGAFFQQQLAQMIWAGELEEWLDSPPTFHLVAEPGATGEWRGYFGEEQPVVVVPPLAAPELAALTARRATDQHAHTNLLPAEYTKRYHQQFVDRLWMRGLGALLLVYIVLAAAYLVWVRFERFRVSRAESQVASHAQSYTNALQLKERVKVLQDQMDLQFAALDCWKAVADFLPTELTLNTMNFDQGRKLTLMGTASTDDVTKVQDFNEALRKVQVKGQPLFSKINAPTITPQPGASLISWSFNADLKRTDRE